MPNTLALPPFRMEFPTDANISAHVQMSEDWRGFDGLTVWTVELGRFDLFIQLGMQELSELSEFIRSSTKRDASVQEININGLLGVTHGGYGPPRTWIDWWFRSAGITICLNLQSKVFPFTSPTPHEADTHRLIISSIQSYL